MQNAKTQKTHTNDIKPRSRLANMRKRPVGVGPTIMAASAVVEAVAAPFVMPSPSETRLLAPAGKLLNDAARTFGKGAQQALSAELTGVPVVGQIAAEQIDRVIDSVVQAGVVPDDGVTGLDSAFVKAAARRYFDREPTIRVLA